MQPLSNQHRSNSFDTTQCEDRNINEISEWDTDFDIINDANTVSFQTIFRYFDINLNEINKKIVCPFSFHKNGREDSPSLYYYPENNNFWCFGCKTGSRPVDFIAAYENITKIAAAKKIIANFYSDIEKQEKNHIDDTQSYSDKIKVILQFSNLVREFKFNYQDQNAQEFIEEMCKAYDYLYINNNLTNKALEFIFNRCKEKIEEYKECHI